MKTFFFCLLGAVSWAIVGAAAALLFVAVHSDGNDLGDAFGFMGLAPVGLILGAILGVVLALILKQYATKNWSEEQAKRKNFLIVTGSVLAAPILTAALIWDAGRYGGPPPDQQLLADFARHRTDLEKVAQMKQADRGLLRVDYNWTEPDNPQKVGVPIQRVAKYRRLLESAGVHRGFEAYQPHEVDFLYWGRGSAISSDTDKGYAYLTVPPKQVLKTLDDCQPDEKNGVEAYRHIEGHWYLYYKYLPG